MVQRRSVRRAGINDHGRGVGAGAPLRRVTECAKGDPEWNTRGARGGALALLHSVTPKVSLERTLEHQGTVAASQKCHDDRDRS